MDAPTRYAEIAVASLPLPRTYHYLVPPEWQDILKVGARVEAPFGRTRRIGFCLRRTDHIDFDPARARSITAVLDPEPLLTPELLALGADMTREYLCGPGEALAALLPAGVRKGRRARRVTYVSLPPVPPEAGKLSAAARRVLEALAAAGPDPIPMADVLKTAGTTAGPVRTLARSGLVLLEERGGEDPLGGTSPPPDRPFDLTPEQAAAIEQLRPLLEERRHGILLLLGVTGSGKTEVYLHAIAEVRRAGRQALVLVPEIALTPQAVRRFRARFRDDVAVLHSSLTEGQRADQWRAIRDGRAGVVVGVRSSVFAPFQDLGLVVLDEEHENSYKQDAVPRYHARTMALHRAEAAGAAVILGSASPSLESYELACQGSYLLARLPRRIGQRPLPPVAVVDMNAECADQKRHVVFSRTLVDGIRRTLDAGRQVILFQNRRGFTTLMRCASCKEILRCRRCTVSLTYHAARTALLCHYCSESSPLPARCPACGRGPLRGFGTGTQKVEEAARELFPEKTSARMDSDTMRSRRDYDRTLDGLHFGDIDVLVGTQMVGKGLDEPGVGLVGVISADTHLYLEDFRSAERTFQLLLQVAGRTGRGPAGGRVVVQTFNPSHYSIRFAAAHDYEGFAEHELEMRRILGYPPFGRLVRILVEGRNLEVVRKRAAEIAVDAREALGAGGKCLGPAPAPLARLRGRHRYHCLLRGPRIEPLREAARAARPGGAFQQGGIHVILDPDPVSLL